MSMSILKDFVAIKRIDTILKYIFVYESKQEVTK